MRKFFSLNRGMIALVTVVFFSLGLSYSFAVELEDGVASEVLIPGYISCTVATDLSADEVKAIMLEAFAGHLNTK